MNDKTLKRKLCSLPTKAFREEELKQLEAFDPLRSFAILGRYQKWVAGSVLTYYFFDQDSDGGYLEGKTQWVSWVGAETQKNQVRLAFQTWKNVGINLDFKEVSDRQDAVIRIGFMVGDGSWSAVGTDCLKYKEYKNVNNRTMNIGWDIVNDFDTALHEVGHALGLNHEHQSQKAGIVWNEPAVYKHFQGDPNYWRPDDIKSNILDKVRADEVQDSSWDPDSCMHYYFDAGLISNPEKYQEKALKPAGGLSARDREWVRKFYPLPGSSQVVVDVNEPLKILKSVKLNITNGQQVNYPVNVTESREYSIQLSGESDAVIVLFENTAQGWKQIKASDDSGHSRNALIRVMLYAGREYNLRVRLYWEGKAGNAIVTLW